MLIKKHDKTRIVELEDGSLWRIWPGDIALTLNWLPTTDLRVSEIADEFCSHALIDQNGGSRVRVIEASKNWPVEQVPRTMKKGKSREPPINVCFSSETQMKVPLETRNNEDVSGNGLRFDRLA